MGDRRSDSLRILLVDDQVDVRSTYKLVLDIDHHAVVEAGDGLEALERFEEGGFDLVITDNIMPELSGEKLALEIKKQRPEMPVIMITANPDILPAKLTGVDLLLTKPFQVAELQEAIRKVT